MNQGLLLGLIVGIGATAAACEKAESPASVPVVRTSMCVATPVRSEGNPSLDVKRLSAVVKANAPKSLVNDLLEGALPTAFGRCYAYTDYPGPPHSLDVYFAPHVPTSDVDRMRQFLLGTRLFKSVVTFPETPAAR
jgi:hypothetical protein